MLLMEKCSLEKQGLLHLSRDPGSGWPKPPRCAQSSSGQSSTDRDTSLHQGSPAQPFCSAPQHWDALILGIPWKAARGAVVIAELHHAFDERAVGTGIVSNWWVLISLIRLMHLHTSCFFDSNLAEELIKRWGKWESDNLGSILGLVSPSQPGSGLSEMLYSNLYKSCAQHQNSARVAEATQANFKTEFLSSDK